ncbi:MAG: membrane dipeptidase [Acidobacteriota bacterium]
MSVPVYDLHCDLPIFLALASHFNEARTVFDLRSRCSVPQMREGGVAFQALALFAPPSPDSAAFGMHEAETLARSLEKHADSFQWIRSLTDLDEERAPDDPRIRVMAAVEGASTFADEAESLDESFARFDRLVEVAGPLLYVSLTWVPENRFGGGNASPKGLLDDGRVLLDFLAARSVAVDVSHASPRLAHDILDYSYAKDLDLTVLASHSPYAALKDIPRNLPNEVAKEIASRGGVIGLNVMQPYVEGPAPQAFVDQLKHARELGILDAQAMGADFFCTDDIPPDMRKPDAPDDFFADFGDSSCYPRLLEALQEGMEFSDDELAAVAHRNADRFLRRVLDDVSSA